MSTGSQRRRGKKNKLSVLTKKRTRNLYAARFMVAATYTVSVFVGLADNIDKHQDAITKILSTWSMSPQTLHMTLDGQLFSVLSETAEVVDALITVSGGLALILDRRS